MKTSFGSVINGGQMLHQLFVIQAQVSDTVPRIPMGK